MAERSAKERKKLDPEIRKMRRAKVHQDYMSRMGKPKGLSCEARFMECRPVEVSPIEWLRLFTPDEDIWPFLAEEAVDVVKGGDRIG
jgi:hypothetical protein